MVKKIAYSFFSFSASPVSPRRGNCMQYFIAGVFETDAEYPTIDLQNYSGTSAV